MSQSRQCVSFVHVLGIGMLSFIVGCASDTPTTPELSPDEARLATLQEAVAQNQENVERRYTYANALFDLDRFEEAATQYRAILEREPEHVNALCNLGLCLRRTGDLSGALESYRRALDVEPDDSTTLQNYVLALQANGQSREALNALIHLGELHPENHFVHRDTADLALSLESYEVAAEALEQIVTLMPSDADVHYHLGLANFYMANMEKASKSWGDAVRLKSNHRLALQALVQLNWQQDQYDAAWEYAAQCERYGVSLDSELLEKLRRDSGRTGPS